MPRPTKMRAVGGEPAAKAYVAYYRVSTQQQGRSGLGLDAQKEAISRHVAAASGRLIAEFQEIESGKRADRPQLAAALAACRARAAVLIVAKLDRLARDSLFCLTVSRDAGEGGVVFCDFPDIPPGATGKFFLTLLAAVAELEAGLISQRTRAALAAAKARGVRLGNPNLIRGDLSAAAAGRLAQSARAGARADAALPYVQEARAAGCTSLRAIASALTARGVSPPSGGEVWHPQQVRRVLARSNT